MSSDRDTLPTDVVPRHYDLNVQLGEGKENWEFTGLITIEVEIVRATSFIYLNVNQLVLHLGSLKYEGASESLECLYKTYDETRQTVSLEFSKRLDPGIAYLSLSYDGTINDQMAGFYRSRYKIDGAAATSDGIAPTEGDQYCMFSTQFEACDARRALPCFDEPSLKATFQIRITAPEKLTVLSNMPIEEERDLGNGLKNTVFKTTPKMSTYLLAWAIGDFECVESLTERKYNGSQLPVRVWTTRGLKEQGKFALENACKIVDYFSETFKIDYPLPKIDLLAVHEFSHGAMENWGLITYRTTAVLFDEKNSDAKYKNRVAYVVAHELAHQWFGNLVTMAWWNELWLNEGFATWVGWLAIDHFYPDWNVWGQFISESLNVALELDSLRNSHPIEVPVRDALEVEQVFDHISYLKGSSVIRMLSAHLTADVFLYGVSIYLKKHSYGNATTKDLWKALTQASNQNITFLMTEWIQEIGFPVLNVAEEGPDLKIKQHRFLLTGDVKEEEDEITWWIPFGTSSDKKGRDDVYNNLVPGGFFKLNKDQTGFFRTNYTAERLAKISSAKDKLSNEDKIGLVGDATALSISGQGTASGLLALLEGFRDEESFFVWSQVITSLKTIRSVFSDDPNLVEALRLFTLKLVSPAVDKLGWEFKADEGFLVGRLRSLLIASAGLSGHDSIVSEAKRQFKAYVESKGASPIHPNLRVAVFCIAIATGGREELEAVKREILTTTSVDGKEIGLQSLGGVQTEELAEEVLEFLFSPAVALQDVHTGAAALAANPRARLALWRFVRNKWDTLVRVRLAANTVVLDRFIRLSLSQFASTAVANEVADFFKDKDVRGFDRSLGVVQDKVRAAAAYKDRDAAAVSDWLQDHGYFVVPALKKE